MLLQVGPLPSASVEAWVTYAREKIDEVRSDPFDRSISDELITAFMGYLDEWAAAAASSPEFQWETEIPSELAEYQVHAFHRIVTKLAEAAELRGEPLQPPEGEGFYRALVNAIIDALQMEGSSAAEYAAYLRSFWPGFDELSADRATEEA